MLWKKILFFWCFGSTVYYDGKLQQYCRIQSETYSVTDCIYFDDMSSDTTSRYYYNPTNCSMTYSDGYITITALQSNKEHIVDLRNMGTSIQGKTVNFEVEVETNGMTGLVLRTLNLPSLYSTTVSDGVNVLENVVIPSDNTNVIFRLIKTSSVTGNSFKFKNVKIYPV